MSKAEVGIWLPPYNRDQVVDQLQHDGAVLVHHVITEVVAATLAQAARELSYVRQPEEYGLRRVKQIVAKADLLPHHSLWSVADRLDEAIQGFFGPDIFASRLQLSHRNVQYYEHGTLGIEPHRDESNNHNIIALCTLSGEGRFTLYHDVGYPAKRWFLFTPGCLLLMVAPGFRGQSIRPVHGVDQICGPRYVLGLRQTVTTARKEDAWSR